MTPWPYFQLQQNISDVRVSPLMEHCTKCGGKLPEQQTLVSGSAMLLFAQCHGCNMVFIQDFADFDPQKESDNRT